MKCNELYATHRVSEGVPDLAVVVSEGKLLNNL